MAAKTRQNIDRNFLLYLIYVSIEVLSQWNYEQTILTVIMKMVINNAENTVVNNLLLLSTETETPLIDIFIMSSLRQQSMLLNFSINFWKHLIDTSSEWVPNCHGKDCREIFRLCVANTCDD